MTINKDKSLLLILNDFLISDCNWSLSIYYDIGYYLNIRICKMKKISVLFLIFMLTACAAPTRTDVDEFFVVSTGTIIPDSVPLFVDCLIDGFNQSHSGLTNFEVRQSMRSTGYRVETYTGSFNYLLVSADVFTDGRVVLHESSSAGWINTNGEKETFGHCMQNFESSIVKD